MPEHDRLKRLTIRLAEGDFIDWEAEERAASTESERADVRELRLVAAMVRFQHEIQAAPPGSDLSDQLSLARSSAGLLESSASGAESRTAEGNAPVLRAGSRWAHLEILERVGAGAWGEVYRARDTRLDRTVALKLLYREVSGPGDEIIREARILARVRHPNVVTVFGADRVNGRVGIWMEFLQGETLERVLRSRGTLDPREAALIGSDLCRALSAVHAAGILHQDLKLANVMRAQGGRIVLTDFGLGRESRPSPELDPNRAVSGTPLYMAPEVLRGETAGPRSDLYSLGVVLFALVTGTLPVRASSLAGLRRRHETGEVRHARDLRPDLPQAFAAALDRLLSKDPRSRFATAGAVEQALLQTLGAGAPFDQTSSRGAGPGGRAALFSAAGMVLLLLVLGGWWGLVRHRRATASAPVFRDAPAMSLFGSFQEEMFGGSLACVGDVNQDGIDDALIGAPGNSERAFGGGKAYVYHGSRTGLDRHPAWSITGDEPEERLGWSVAGQTNLSFDGYPDLVVGAPGPDSATSTVGRVLVFLGSRNGFGQKPDQVLTDGRSGTRFGYAVATGDVNHDGHDDLLVGEPGYPSAAESAGRVLLYLAGDTGYVKTPAWIGKGSLGSEFGISVSLGGDVNNDGYRDAVVGAMSASFGPQEGSAGAAYVYLGSATGLDSIPIVIPGRQAGAMMGRGVLIPGDLDGDGYADVLVGGEDASNGEQSEGVVEVYFGCRSGIDLYGARHLEPDVAGANLGGRLAVLGDLNGDGRDDFFVGAVRYQRTEPREGAAYVIGCSPQHELRRLWFHLGDAAGSWYGTAAAAGDFDGNRKKDLLVSAPAWDTETGTNAGRVDLFLRR